MSSLNKSQVSTIQGLCEISPTFREQFDKLVKVELDRAQALVQKLSGFSVEGKTEVEKPKPSTTGKKRGRPVGSVNKKPKQPKPSKVVVEEPVALTAEATTHAQAINSVLTKDGLSAGAVFDAVSALKISGYSAPSKKTLYTILSSMKAKGQVKTKGERPNTLYVA